MARNVFFSFHYDNDVQRAFVVRQSWVTRSNRTATGVIDRADFESIKKNGDAAIKRWIDGQLVGTSVTVVLIGSETLQRPYVQYEIEKSKERGNGIIGVFVSNIRGFDGMITSRCSTMGFKYPLYDWVTDDGYNNLGTWVEKAAQAVGK